MTLLIKILSVLGRILLAVFLLVLWIVLVPRHFWVEYSKHDGPTVKMNIGPFKIGLYPLPSAGKKKTEGQKTDTNKKDPPQEKQKFNPLDDIQLSMQLVKDVVSAAKGIMAKILSSIKFCDVSFTLPIHNNDVYKTQKMYGLVTNSFYSLAVFLQKHMQITFKSPIFVADFAGTYKDSTYFYTQITASPVLLLLAAWYAYTQYNEITTNHKKASDAAEKEKNNG